MTGTLTEQSILRVVVAGALVSILLGGCATGGSKGGRTELDATIMFDADNCPIAVLAEPQSECTSPGNGNKVCAQKGQWVYWQSVDTSGSEIAGDYRIYFDPFKTGPTIGSNGQGLAKAKIDTEAPEVEYKYTVIGDDCPDDPLDPRIIVY